MYPSIFTIFPVIRTASAKIAIFTYRSPHFYRAIHMHKRGICRYAVSVRPSVCPSVTFVSCVKMNKDIFKIFSPPGSQDILVFPCQTGWRYPDGNPPKRGGGDRITRKLLKIDRYMLRGVWRALNCLSIHAT